MITRKLVNFINFIGVLCLFLLMCSVSVYASDCHVYRLYNPANDEHLYTTNYMEVYDLVVNKNWTDEGIGWTASDSGNPVYRLYSPQLGEHLYTTDQHEMNDLTTKHGWIKDNNGQPLFTSSGNIPVYRLYKGSTGRHHLTLDGNECSVLTGQGWNQEGIAFYASTPGNSIPVTNHNNTQCPYGVNCPSHHDSAHCVYGVNCPIHHDSFHCVYGDNCPGYGNHHNNTSNGSHHSESHH